MGCMMPGYMRGRERASTTTGALHNIFIFFLHCLLTQCSQLPTMPSPVTRTMDMCHVNQHPQIHHHLHHQWGAMPLHVPPVVLPVGMCSHNQTRTHHCTPHPEKGFATYYPCWIRNRPQIEIKQVRAEGHNHQMKHQDLMLLYLHTVARSTRLQLKPLKILQWGDCSHSG